MGNIILDSCMQYENYPISAGAADYWMRVRLSVCPFVRLSVNNFYSALDLPCYWAESNETLHSERIYIVVVHLGIGFIEQRKMCLLDLIENHDFFNN